MSFSKPKSIFYSFFLFLCWQILSAFVHLVLTRGVFFCVFTRCLLCSPPSSVQLGDRCHDMFCRHNSCQPSSGTSSGFHFGGCEADHGSHFTLVGCKFFFSFPRPNNMLLNLVLVREIHVQYICMHVLYYPDEGSILTFCLTGQPDQ